MMIKSLSRTRIFFLSFVLLTCPLYLLDAQKAGDSGQPGSFSFVYVTDIHLDYNTTTLQYFDQAVNTINELDPDFIITGGDNIKDATQPRRSYADSLFNLYLSQIKRFRMPVYTGIGNHECFGINNPDISDEDPLFGKKMYESRIGKRYYTFTHKGWKFFMIDDIRITDTGHKYIGHIDDEQMEWLKNELSATDFLTPVVVCSHIPFISSMKKFEFGSLAGNPDNDGVSNSIEFFRLFEHHNLKLLLQGHFHFFEVLYTNNIYYVTGPSLNGRYGSMLTKTAGYILFTTDGDRLSWQLIKNEL
ncbi:MAG TPA: metallophosphoesterase [Bacteroidales bacterium]|jgi:hypothetical protein|nr:metallophosphoesterase [Bacteroidales bacterium]HQJ82993.1 metallophosphoesterase [Bacteroidales bacterium]